MDINEIIENLKSGKYDGFYHGSEMNGVENYYYIKDGEVFKRRTGKTPKPFFDGKETIRDSAKVVEHKIESFDELNDFFQKIGYKFYDYPEVREFSKDFYNLNPLYKTYKSATKIGEKFGLTGQEMNFVLREEGFLEGVPGNYVPTEKGTKFAKYTDEGYLKFDDDIASELEITQERKEQLRLAMKEAKKKAASPSVKETIDEEIESINKSTSLTKEEKDNKLLIIGLVVILASAAVIGAIKLYPHAKKWWEDKIEPSYKHDCPNCLSEKSMRKSIKGIWECKNCGYSISHEYLKNGYVYWFCDECGSFLNTQEGFDSFKDEWICTKCGHTSPLILSSDNIDE